jgi:SH3 domain protein
MLVAPPLSFSADTQYVSDKLIITMRSGAGADYKILKTLHTGTPVEILEKTDKYYKVRTTDAKEGWVLKQYITAELPKATVISGLKREMERSKARLKGETEKSKARIEKLNREMAGLRGSLKSEKGLRRKDVRALEMGVSEYKDKISETTRQLKELRGKHAKLVEDSADVVKVVSERDALKEEFALIAAENDDLSQENKRLLTRNMIYWFLAGGGVFLLGWIIGQISRRRKSGSFMR